MNSKEIYGCSYVMMIAIIPLILACVVGIITVAQAGIIMSALLFGVVCLNIVLKIVRGSRKE